MVCCHPSYLGGRGRRIERVRLAWAKLWRPYLKNKRTGGEAQVVEHFQFPM
jgi:hypothetical protein